ncbi:unnamed protein product [Miscanthus lutarioriparius]|uniref:Uncharacterized protein n=1 Tax=Miscanthus lutarioriparius TaxID=422564 RepID=A0A811PGE2_9POAL|nr:unnamed protein product [Miscanthus lutarioriparius]
MEQDEVQDAEDFDPTEVFTVEDMLAEDGILEDMIQAELKAYIDGEASTVSRRRRQTGPRRPGSWDPEVPPGRRRRRSCCCRLAVRRGGERTNHHCDCEPSSHYHAIATSAVALAGLPNNLRARYGAGLVLLSMAADVSTPGGGAYGRRSQTHGMIVSPGLAAVRDQASSGIHEPIGLAGFCLLGFISTTFKGVGCTAIGLLLPDFRYDALLPGLPGRPLVRTLKD